MKLYKKEKLAVLAALGICFPAAAYAQSLLLEEVVVTAQKREESLQQVPLQVAAFTAQNIVDAKIGTTQDFANMVSNVSLDDSDTYNNTFVVVRGVTQINNADAPVAIVVDGVAQNNQKQFKMNLFDVERIEVLKGPQGALYGRNAIGGAINIVTRQPGDEVAGFVNASYGNERAIDVSAGVSGPVIKDTLLYRLSGSYKKDDGRIDNVFLNTSNDFIDHDYAVRGRLQWHATEALAFDLRASHRDFEAGSQYDTPVFSGNPNVFDNPESNIRGATTGDATELTLKFDANLDFATLTGITGYTELTEVNRGDLDFRNPVNSPGGFLGLGIQVGQGQDLKVEMLSQELRLVSPEDNAFRWIAGTYAIQTDRSLRTRGFIDADSSFDQINNPVLILIDRAEDNDNKAYAFFAQLDYDIGDQLTVSAALRYDKDEREQLDLNTGAVRTAEYDDVQPKLTLTYDIDDDKLAYATYSTGFRSGGINAPGLPVFGDETLDNFEVGFKTVWLNRRLIVNGAAYLSQVDGFQFFFVRVADAAQIINNIEEVDIFGVELEVQALLAPGLELSASVGTTDSDIEKISALPGNEGNHAPKTTRVSSNIALQYRAPVGGGLEGIIRADYEYRGRKYWQVDNADSQDPLSLLNLRAGVETDTWGVFLWGKNLTDEDYFTDFNPTEFSGLDVDIGYLGQPRTYGIEGRLKF